MTNRFSKRLTAIERELSKNSDESAMDTLRLVLRSLSEIHKSDGLGPFDPTNTITRFAWRQGWTPERVRTLIEQHWATA